jgi:hypothetical protein
MAGDSSLGDGGASRTLPCPSCSAALPAGAVPRASIVLCAQCCAVLFWDVGYTLASDEQLAGLPEVDRMRLHVLLGAQRARRSCPLREN